MIRATEIDLDASTLRLEFSDGRIVRGPMTSEIPGESAVRRLRADIQQRVLELTLDDGRHLTVDIGLPRQRVPSGTPVLYLDQLHWVSLAQCLWAPDRLRESERQAARTLVSLAREQRILLPCAAAHFTEMAGVTGRRRRDLALTIFGLSRGWQMQSPLRIRGEEYTASLLGRPLALDGVFTLDPGVLFAGGPKPPSLMSGIPHDLAEAMSRVIAMSAVCSAILGDEPLDMSRGDASAERWATGFPPLAAHMRERGVEASQARLMVHGRFISDQSEDVAAAAARAGVTQDRLAEWLNDELPLRFAQMPYVARLEEVMYLRLRNADDRWQANDLNDLNFLCAAAAYADITIGEKKTTEYLRRAESRVPSGSELCRRLSEGVELLAARGISP